MIIVICDIRVSIYYQISTLGQHVPANLMFLDIEGNRFLDIIQLHNSVFFVLGIPRLVAVPFFRS